MKCNEDIERFKQCPINRYCQTQALLVLAAKESLYDTNGLIQTSMQSVEAAENLIARGTFTEDQILDTQFGIAQVREGLLSMISVLELVEASPFDLDRISRACLKGPQVDSLGTVSCQSLAINEEERAQITLRKDQ